MLALYISLGVIALVLIVGFILPRKIHVARSVSINTEPQAIYECIVSLEKFTNWSPWSDRDPNMEQTFEGPRTGVDATMIWSGNKHVGKGQMKIIAVKENASVDTEINFGRGGTVKARWIIEHKDDKCKLIWTLDSDLGMNPLGRYFGLFMDRMIGKDYEHGLNKLKAQLEGKA